MLQIFSKLRAYRGFTLVETLVALGVFVVVMGVGAQLFLRSYATDRRVETSRELYEETRILMEHLVKEVRRGTVDYEEYWSWSQQGATAYGQNYGEYAAKFFAGAPAKSGVTRQTLNLGQNQTSNHPLVNVAASARCTGVPFTGGLAEQQCELYLISADGLEKTILKVVPEVVGTATEYRLSMLKMIGGDTDGDTIADTWQPAAGYITAGGAQQFQPIQPDSLTITDFKFYVAPLEDPRRSFADFSNSIQTQPHVTIVLSARPTAKKLRGILGGVPTITLQTTVTARAQSEVKSLPF